MQLVFKMRFKFFFIFLFFLFFSNSVLGLGISPGRVEIDFEPNLQTSFEMAAVNRPARDQVAEIYYDLKLLGEDLAYEYENVVSFERNKIPFTSEEESTERLMVYLNFPEGFSEGGIHELRVGVRPYVEPGEGLVIRAGNELSVFISVSEEYVDGKYKVVKDVKIIGINAGSVKQGEIADIEVKIKSESEVLLNDVYAVVKILNKGDEIRSLETDKISIGPNEEKILSTRFNPGALTGSLVLNVEVFYGSDSIRGNGILNVIGEEGGGFTVEEKKFSIKWWWIVIGIVILLLLLIILLMFILLMKKMNEGKGKKR